MLYRPLRNGLEQVQISQRLGSQGARRRAPRPRCRHTSSLGTQLALKQGLGSWEPLPEQATLRFCTPSPPCPSDHGLFREHFAEASQPPHIHKWGVPECGPGPKGQYPGGASSPDRDAARLGDLGTPPSASGRLSAMPSTWLTSPAPVWSSRSARQKDLDSGEQGTPST